MKPVKVNKINSKKVLKWCKEHYGPSRFNDIKTLKLAFDDNLKMEEGVGEEGIAVGEYDTQSNTITINLKDLKEMPVISFIDTIIHEYRHFKQYKSIRKYNKYLKYYSYNYENHPYEKTANKIAKRDRWQCYREVFGSES